MCNQPSPATPALQSGGVNLRPSPPPGGWAEFDSASLDALETSVERFDPTSRSIPAISRWSDWKHRRHDVERSAVYSALLGSNEELDRKRLNRILWCNASPVLYATNAGQVRVGSKYCRDRLCPLCNGRRADEVTRKILAMVATAPTTRFLTLTIQSSDSSLAEQLDELIGSWRRLRQRQSWKNHIRSAVGTVEVTWNDERKQWHPHLHILFDGEYWPQPEIADEWAQASKGSRIVDVRAVHDREKTIRYIAKYAAKPAKMHKLPSEQIKEWSHTVHRRRMVIAVGKWAKFKPHAEEELEPMPKQVEVCGMHDLANFARDGMPRMIRLVKSLWSMMPEVCEVIGMPFRPTDKQPGQMTTQEHLVMMWDLLYLRQRLGDRLAPDGPLLKLRELQPDDLPRTMPLFE